MPTIPSVAGFDVLIYTGHEHQPPHVHVFRAGRHLRVALGDEDPYPFVIGKSNTMTGKDLVRAVRLLAAHGELRLARRREIHD
jgi:hypothetical protein